MFHLMRPKALIPQRPILLIEERSVRFQDSSAQPSVRPWRWETIDKGSVAGQTTPSGRAGLSVRFDRDRRCDEMAFLSPQGGQMLLPMTVQGFERRPKVV